MYPHIVCFCGKSLGDIYDAFKIMRRKKIQEALDDDTIGEIDPTLLAITDGLDIDMSDVFEQLGVYCGCCKVRLTTQTEFKELY